jgi:hypothetical protein
MAFNTAFIAFQTPWGCRWSRLSNPESGAAEESKTPGLWVCVRPAPEGNARSIRGVDCAACPHWERSPTVGRILWWHDSRKRRVQSSSSGRS